MISAEMVLSSLDIIALIAIGFCVGTAGSFLGIGGAFLATPALNILGFPMVYAIGTDLAHMTGKSVVATLRHMKLGHVDWKAGGLLIIGTTPGVQSGAATIVMLEQAGQSDSVVRLVYIALLTILGTLILRESLLSRDKAEYDGTQAFFRRRFRIRPFVFLKTSGIREISVWSVIFLGFVTGFVASFLGVGGGFIRMPAMIYLLGMPTKIAVGTDLLEVLFSGGYGTFLYARRGWVHPTAAFIMLLGASVGSQIGAIATRYVETHQIRLCLAIMVLGTAVAVTVKQLGATLFSVVVLLILGITLATSIIYWLVVGLKRQRAEYNRALR